MNGIHIPLDRALLCSECSAIYGMDEPACPSCTATPSIALARVLDAPPIKRVVRRISGQFPKLVINPAKENT